MHSSSVDTVGAEVEEQPGTAWLVAADERFVDLVTRLAASR
jgi:hypothetical protein